MFEPDWGGDPRDAVRVVTASRIWDADRLVDLIGVLLTLGALTIAGRMFAGAGREWARIGQPFLVLMAATGAGAVIANAVMKDLANSWQRAPTDLRAPYLAVFDSAQNLAEDMFFVAFLALALYLAGLAAAILTEPVFPPWIGWAALVDAGLIGLGDLLSIVADAAFFAVLAGFALFLVILVALGAVMWRTAARASTPGRNTLIGYESASGRRR